ncbi:VOC family protein [Streptomyces sp. NPDC002680]|uniref:VOC family protein n=1 Tax=Streptomyces sp. NPDC002680 TaxID=3364659 RepID=UPI0036B70EC8
MTHPALRLAHTGITVADLDRSLAFWNGALGFDVLFRAEADGVFAARATGVPGADLRVAMLDGHGHSIELIEYVGPVERHVLRPRPCDVGSWHVAFMVDDLDQVLSVLESHGFHAVGPAAVIESGPRAGGKAVYTHDPDGTTVELIQPPAGSS